MRKIGPDQSPSRLSVLESCREKNNLDSMTTATPETAATPSNTATPQGSNPTNKNIAAASAKAYTKAIPSYVSQRAHITPGQQRALELLKPRWAIPYQEQLLDIEQVFGRAAPTVIEIGSGMGEATFEIAQQQPQTNFIAIEVFDAGVGALLRRIDEHQCPNLRVIQYDAVAVLRDMIADSTLAGVHVYFPDPWPKKRHHKRRLIQAPFVDLVAQRLAPNGYIHCATDWGPYAEQMLEVLSQCPTLKNRYLKYAPRPATRPLTKFERRGLRLGHGVWDLTFDKTA